ncbi:MAG: chemotaxis protein CheW [Oligoflexales bacterium]
MEEASLGHNSTVGINTSFDTLHFIFKLCDFSYALPFDQVDFVVPYPELTKLPNVTDDIVGHFEFKDWPIIVIDKTAKLSKKKSELIILKVQDIKVGICVDELMGVKRLIASTNDVDHDTPFPYNAIFKTENSLTFRLDLEKFLPVNYLKKLLGHFKQDIQSNTVQNSSSEEIENEKDQQVIIRIGPHLIAVELTQIREFHPSFNCTPSPSNNKSLIGTINLRGEIGCIYDVGSFFNGTKSKLNKTSIFILYDFPDIGLNGVLVDEIISVNQDQTYKIIEKDLKMEGFPQEFYHGIVCLENSEALVFDLKSLLKNIIKSEN